MVNPEYSVVKRQINKDEHKVKQAIQRFQPENLNSNDLVDYLSKLKEISALQNKLEDLMYNILDITP